VGFCQPSSYLWFSAVVVLPVPLPLPSVRV